MGQNGDKTAKAGKNGNVPPAEHQFREGNPGGPGRPKSKPLTDALRTALEAGDDASVADIIKVGLRKAKAGDYRFWKEVWDRIDGKVADSLDVTTKGESLRPGLADLPEELFEKVNEALGGPEE